ncbi:MAG TPA: pyridoxal 5'-phosphate synthase glutaminase subunit PdxT [Syntrophothermus lipocalidus]|uniref:Pyridoxal 5'-phosphate synthase subunit PdxT n=1 Tax=Syntrophothermus lipocalidus (strain DSM 12680 / TGB-C1) TaxID=643648 RepID=D7CIF1_SYNLT|nr:MULTISPECIES: pyridoxal 5'-phosphate synthase glutaminase subunit PdxT [Syntrophothermus]ADI00816.1 SNO glutamine amidotransferase [Syntrophothermus lipocalidus DSM 12680]NSW83516.1 pyridoxal 5'-phosphate synthase glutaminase subunit PdxT [Syntrophothermus sp.]HHV76601.1 pyridoxal 5'-phosphate synthase glutaminase subunit PdxT [Syntrophothermus lipocalidus]HOV42748.1 pyridoxal 5'-phosphate synthase glutaminase subunit PdxT [Syntrophothermus lipocalidus]
MAGKKRIGVLALQGAFAEHQEVLHRLGCEATRVRSQGDIRSVDGLIIPGGESTTIGRLLVDFNLADTIRQAAEEGMPVFGTCAGMIVLAKEIIGSEQFRLGLMDMAVRRNAFGRQVESFEEWLDIKGFERQVKGVFIRAPYVEKVWGGAEVLAELDGKIVMVRQGKLLATAFHPELTDDLVIHEYFVRMA